jgi:hypothetical protein
MQGTVEETGLLQRVKSLELEMESYTESLGKGRSRFAASGSAN